MPMPFIGRAPYHIAGTYFPFGTALALYPPTSGGDNQRLTKWMSVPCRVCTGLKCDAGAADASGRRRLEKWIDANVAGEIFFRPFGGRL